MNWIYSRIAAFGAAVLAVLLAIARFAQVKRQRNEAREDRERMAAQIGEANDIAESDIELANEFSDLKRESGEAIDNGKMPDHMRNRNDY